MTVRLVAFATQGSGGDDEARLRALLEQFNATFLTFDRQAKVRSCRRLLRSFRTLRPHLVVMEGTGWAGGIAVILGKWLLRIPYVFSSGDAIGPMVGAIAGPVAGWVFGIYERVLCRHAAGFIGWTPYLVGRALTFGVPRALTAAGWAPRVLTIDERAAARRRIRERLGIPADDLVIGLVGSLAWNRRQRYTYGLELVRAAQLTRRSDAHFIIVGDGDGRSRLQQLAGDRVHLTGHIPRHEVPEYLAAFDLASLPQSVNGVGSFRYTTKLSEYLGAGLPILTGPIPLAYDLDGGWLWRVPADLPWSPEYAFELARLIDGLQPVEIASKKGTVPVKIPEFDRTRQVEQVTRFVHELRLRDTIHPRTKSPICPLPSDVTSPR